MIVSNDTQQSILFCPLPILDAIISILSNSPLLTKDGVSVIALEQNDTIAIKAIAIESGYVLERYLDRYYVLWGESASCDRQSMIDILFEYIGEDYDQQIDILRNTQNIENLLLWLVEDSPIVRSGVILDFGCGTGLSSAVSEKMGLNVVGVDRCKVMRKIARSRGMTVWSPKELENVPLGPLGGVFASYVFHLRPADSDLLLTWEKLRSGGLLAANFHKQAGVSTIETLLCNRGAELVVKAKDNGYGEHGIYVGFKKP